MYAIRMDNARGVFSVHPADERDLTDNRVLVVENLEQLVDKSHELLSNGFVVLGRVDPA